MFHPAPAAYAYVSQGRAVEKTANRQRRSTRRARQSFQRRAARQAPAQRKAYVSQGRAVEKVANRQRRAAATRAHEVRDVKSNADRQRAERFKATPVYRKALVDTMRERADTVIGKRVNWADPAISRLHDAGLITPSGHGFALKGDTYTMSDGAHTAALKILEQTTRPTHAIAGGVNAALHGQSVLAAAGRGIRNKDKTTFGDVLRGVGAPKAVAAVGGFGLDVLTDPTTYVSFGTASVARNAAERAGVQAARRAVKAGMSEAGAATVAKRAAKAAGEAAPRSRGVTVGFATPRGNTAYVPGVLRASAAAGRVAGKAAGRSPRGLQRAAGGVKNIAREFRPSMAPAGVDQAQFVAARQAARGARAQVNQAMARHQATARALQRKIGRNNYEDVIDAIEKGRLRDLTDPKLREAAIQLRSSFRHAKRLRARAGLREGTIRDYFPHAREDALHRGLGVTDEPVEGLVHVSGRGRTIKGPGSSKARMDRRELLAINRDRFGSGEVPFSTNIPLVHLNYMSETSRVAAQSDMLRRLAESGRTAKPGGHLRDGEAIYHLGFDNGRFGLREVKQVGTKAGRYVVLHKKTVEDAMASARPAQATNAVAATFDKATGQFKRLATATPGFHVRNLIGDTQMAYLEQSARRLPVNVAQSGRALRRLTQQERDVRKGAFTPSGSAKTIKVAGKHQNVDEFLSEAKKQGVVRSGFVGREVDDLLHGGKKSLVKIERATGPLNAVKRFGQQREDLLRLATYKYGLDRGLKPAQAADRAMQIHIDYGDLTEFERRVMRRAMPFYTFSARALPLHVKKFATNPGKFAQYEKVREEAGGASGVNEDRAKQGLQEFQLRQAPLVVKIGRGPQALSAALPLTLLNEVPTSTDPSAYLDELGQFTASMVNPIFKNPVELYANRSFFFRNDIQRPEAPLVAAPKWVANLPQNVRSRLGIVPDYVDKRTGKKTWGWPGRVDYAVKQFPGAPNIINQLSTSATNRRGQGQAAKFISALVGVKADPLDPTSVKIVKLYDESNKIAEQLAKMRQRGINAQSGNAKYRTLLDRQHVIDAQINGLSSSRGDVIPLKRKPGGGRSSSGGFSSGWSTPSSSSAWNTTGSSGW